MTTISGATVSAGVVLAALLTVPFMSNAASYIKFDGVDGEVRATFEPQPVTIDVAPISDLGDSGGSGSEASPPRETSAPASPQEETMSASSSGSPVPAEEGASTGGAPTEVPAQQSEPAPTDDAETAGVAVSADALRELSADDRTLLIESAPPEPEAIETPEQLRSFVAATIEQTPAIDAVLVEDDKVLVRYSAPTFLFGFIPFTVTETIELTPGQGDEEYAVSVHKPWYSIFLNETMPGQNVAALAKEKKKPKPESINIESFSFGASQAGMAIKLIAIGIAGDVFEREADQAADR